jgi:hypothetical protein
MIINNSHQPMSNAAAITAFDAAYRDAVALIDSGNAPAIPPAVARAFEQLRDARKTAKDVTIPSALCA